VAISEAKKVKDKEEVSLESQKKKDDV